MAKAARIDDVKRPGRVLPSATSRPILVTDHTDTPATDPMLASSEPDADKKDDALAALNHTARAIEPLTAPTVKSAAGTDAVSVQTPSTDVPEAKLLAPEPKPAAETAAAPAVTITSPTSTTNATESSAAAGLAGESDEPRDPEAAISAEEAAAAEAKAKRQQEVEDVIASGKYVVPINAVQRKRSRTHTLLLCLLAVLLLLVLLDAVFDVGIVRAPNGIPHTHFFSK